jgi:hypothetical protein
LLKWLDWIFDVWCAKGRSRMDLDRAEQKRMIEGLSSTGEDLDRKFWIALVLFAVLGMLAWFTIGDGNVIVMGKPVEIRLVPLVVIGGLMLRTVLARQAEKIRRGSR